MENNLLEYSLNDRAPLVNDFTKTKICDLSMRAAMGLEESYKASSIDFPKEEYASLRKLSEQELVSIIENAEEPFTRRFVAGQLLALLGDPRINVLNPEMIAIPSWTGLLGLKVSEVDEVVETYKNYGIIDEWIRKETPQYTATIQEFQIAKYPVTHQEYWEFLKDTDYAEIPTTWPLGQFLTSQSNHPVHTISSDACVQYAKWLSEKTGRKFRLPTEAEWEYVAGGSDGLEFPWGNTFEKDHCNTVESGIFRSTPIGIFPKGNSPFGCADMAGNVEEYVSDFYHAYDGGELIADDLTRERTTYRVARGGSFTRFRDLARCKRRHGRYMSEIYVMGFRLAEDID
ncbi:serine/threonine-protein kinase pkn1 [Kordia sp. SMS9]|uniref:formylglycine-generating enzyme family protein n=1 Tax=Kordia sp. SMS9 TaxID=2282170 RepID=UPI000E0D9C85|nr:SUMF1/EgtB/PvdO family nonheme iron enzyme [Kordia sp. SMS9]AXG70222.1 serine/threonine-protein kinase pkn1 [Kordia sp. SMS9]